MGWMELVSMERMLVSTDKHREPMFGYLTGGDHSAGRIKDGG